MQIVRRTVTVIGPDVGRLMAPYDENTSVEPYRSYVDPLPEGWRRTIEHHRQFQAALTRGDDRQLAWTSVWGARNDDPHVAFEFHNAIEAGVDPTDLAAVAAHYVSAFGPGDEGDRLLLDEGGLYRMSTYNPQSKWDWYSLGGRWAGRLLLRPGVEPLEGAYGETGAIGGGYHDDDGCHVSRALKATIDWERMAYEQLERDRIYYRKLLDPTSDAARWEQAEAEQARSMAEDEWLRSRERRFSTFAFLGADGEWHENGQLGWWASVHGEDPERDWPGEYNRLLDGVGDDDLVSIIDYHI